MEIKSFAIYLILINIVSGCFFTYDKWAAIKHKFRISELKLHFFELLGGAFANIILIYLLRHKNRKFSYYIWTWLIVILWFVLLYLNMNE
jgi:uncharacterized membrane protein YsdA (DUF1294 family)